MEREVTAGTRSPTTLRLYRSHLDNHVLPALRDLETHDLTVTVTDRLLKAKQDAGYSYETVKTTRAVISGFCGYAVRHRALSTNPIRDVARLSGGRGKQVRALTLAERTDLLERLDAPETAHELDLPELVRMMLASGVRLGELLALTGEESPPTRAPSISTGRSFGSRARAWCANRTAKVANRALSSACPSGRRRCSVGASWLPGRIRCSPQRGTGGATRPT